MSGTVLLHVVSYVALIVFAVAVIARFLKVARMPIHLRWELYPVAHEGKRASYGGSAMEELDWWTKPRHKSRWSELKAMASEIILLVALFHHNRKVWWRSFPFHFGLYCLAAFIGLLVIGAVLEISGITGGGLASAIHWLTMIAGIAGLTLSFLGAGTLLLHRVIDPDLRAYNSHATIFNLLFFVVVSGLGWVTFALADSDFSMSRQYVGSLISLDLDAAVGGGLFSVQVALTAALLAYIPLTHMSHFFMKWFTYHKMRWDDEPNTAGSKIEQRVTVAVQYQPTWAAPHINADGEKNWVDLAVEEIK